MNAKEFEELKKKIENAKNEQAKLSGAIETNLKILKEKFSCNSIEDAEKLLKDFKVNLEESKSRLDELVEELEEILPEDFND